ncbi:MAG: cache domain-containing protein [Sulfurovum sp.]|nr:cache domain-containing protein [Sulfurovum sp.]
MKKIFTLLMALGLLGSGWAAEKEEGTKSTAPQMMLGAAAHYVDTILSDAMDSLELIASSPEAKRGEWKGIRPYLAQLKEKLPGVYSFILPNGDYYTLDRNFTNLNLSNRGYFRPLFTGNVVKGFPIHSRSTGKKSAFVAVPIVVDGKVTGALGISLFLDELNERLNKDFDLPPHYTWYILNEEGNTMLDKESDFIFMSPLIQGSDSLHKAVREALKHDSGRMQYQFEGHREAYYQKLPNFGWRMFITLVEEGETDAPQKLNLTLERFVPELQGQLNRIDASIAKEIEKNGVNIQNEGEVRKLLRSVFDSNPHIVDASFIDTHGVLRLVEPGDYKNFEGSDLSSQEHIIAMLKNPQPLLSGGFVSVEDFLGMVIARPLYDSSNHFAGTISALIRPELFITPMISKSMIPEDYELWIIQTDGMIVYDLDKEEIGKMLFSDPIYQGYESLQKVGRKIAAAPEGEGSYVYLAPGHGEKVVKKVIWKTVKLHDREWRVVLAYRPYD